MRGVKSTGRSWRSIARRSAPTSTRRVPDAPARQPGGKRGDLSLPAEALGRSRGGFTTKLHLACDGRGRPLAVLLTEGQRHDSTQLEALLDAIRVPRRRGRPRKRPNQLCLDRGYSYERCRQVLRRRGLRHVIPTRKDQREQRRKKGSAGGRPPRFDPEIYRERSWIERAINRLKQFRGLATRYEKRAASYLALALFASAILWLRG